VGVRSRILFSFNHTEKKGAEVSKEIDQVQEESTSIVDADTSAASEVACDAVLEKYGSVAKKVRGRENLRSPLNANFLVVIERDDWLNGIRVIPLGFKGPLDVAQKTLKRMIRKGDIPNAVAKKNHDKLLVIPNPLPTADEIVQKQAEQAA